MAKTITKAVAVLGATAGLGIAALPLSSYAIAEDVVVNFTVQSTLGSDNMVCDNGSTTGAAGMQLDITCAVNASSNAGLTISINDKDNNFNLVHTDNTTTIAPIPAREAATGNLTQDGWGYSFVNKGGSATSTVAAGYDNRFNPITAGSVTIIDAATAGTVTGDFKFAAKTPLSQKPGLYTDTVVVTSTAK